MSDCDTGCCNRQWSDDSVQPVSFCYYAFIANYLPIILDIDNGELQKQETLEEELNN